MSSFFMSVARTAIFLVAAKHKSVDGHFTNGEEQNDGPAASTSTASVIDKHVISAIGGLNKQKKRRSGIDPAWKEAFQRLEITADKAGTWTERKHANISLLANRHNSSTGSKGVIHQS
ncbi:hypothetical protein AMECASPLE_026376 [Ameca splendens]|uniref:Myb proto-oncogene protein, plant n=1 Tax=Ameca splendens TaxID=208324 RepID=A0ABV0XTU2_9TELE